MFVCKLPTNFKKIGFGGGRGLSLVRLQRAKSPLVNHHKIFDQGKYTAKNAYSEQTSSKVMIFTFPRIFIIFKIVKKDFIHFLCILTISALYLKYQFKKNVQEFMNENAHLKLNEAFIHAYLTFTCLQGQIKSTWDKKLSLNFFLVHSSQNCLTDIHNIKHLTHSINMK